MKRILVANRGEIACRIIKTCRKLGIETVAVYSDADENALHRELADYSVHIGESEAKASYLNINKILAAVKASKADAVHPGYGFLSENPEFAAALEKKKITFIGPSSKVIADMGDKIAAKEIARKAGAPLLPSIEVEPADAAGAALAPKIENFVKKVGLPVIIKARAGGGGRGMRRVHKRADLLAALHSAEREAQAFFNDGRLFIEKLVERARHIEVQIIGDSKGSIIVVGDRDCSMQRRHQKIIEEAPAPNLSDKTRAAIHKAARDICKKAGYTGAGTVEFLLGQKNDFYFLEVNSRLQVEHPVTEAVTGLDLVELQIAAAKGESLKALKPQTTGHAIEIRICAEAPEENFRAATGVLEDFSLEELEEDLNIRVDTGFRAGDAVSHYYDSLLAKVIASGQSRTEAISRAEEALGACSISGVASNIGYALRLMRSEEFWSASHHIQLAESLLPGKSELAELGIMFAGLLQIAQISGKSADSPWMSAAGFRVHGTAQNLSAWNFCGATVHAGLKTLGRDRFEVFSPEKPSIRSGEIAVLSNDSSPDGTRGILAFTRGDSEESFAFSSLSKDRYWINSSFGSYELRPSDYKLKAGKAAAALESEALASPLPGKVIAVKVRKGERVAEGAPLLVLESMKMEHIIKAPRDGAVVDVLKGLGDIIESNSPLVVLDYRS